MNGRYIWLAVVPLLSGIAALTALGPLNSAQLPGGRPGRASSHVERLPATVRAALSGRLGADQPAYWLKGGHRPLAGNPAQRLRTFFSSAGVSVRTDRDRLVLALRAVGYGGSPAAVAAAKPRTDANRLMYNRGAVREWYANGPLGLEQGFTITRPLSRRPGDALILGLQLGGNLRPTMAAEGSGLLFRAADGQAVLRYSGLTASDASGRSLAARLSLSGSTVRLRVDVHRARYPLTVDPLIENAALIASDGAAEDQLGYSVALSGSTIVAGAPGNAVAGHARQGALYVFSATTSGRWTTGFQVAKLTAANGAADDELGSSLAISGSTIAAGAPGSRAGPGQGGQGAVYVFSAPASGRWQNAVQSAVLTASDGAANDQLGASVAVSGTTIAAGAPEHSVFGQGGAGAVYVFTAPAAGSWSNAAQSAELVSAGGAAGDELGYAVGVSGAAIVASAPGHAVGANADQGAIYEFSAPATGGWRNAGPTAELTAGDGATDDRLGDYVSISGSVIAAGSALHAVGANFAQGAVYVFSAQGAGNWVTGAQTTELTASDGAAGDGFGSAVSVSPSLIAVGAPLHAVGGQDGQGAVYDFVLPASGRWTTGTQSAELTASGGAAGDNLGYNVTTDGAALAAGAPSGAVFAHQDQGVVHVFSGPQSQPPKTGGATTPLLTDVRQSHGTWRAGSQLAKLSRRTKPPVPVGTTFSFGLNVRASVSLTFSRATSRGAARMAGVLTEAARRGKNRLLFQGRLTRSRTLGPGHYTMTILARTAPGHSSRPRRLSFTIVG